MNRCLKSVVPLVVALAATAAWANQSEGANAPAVADTQSSALSPGRITLYEYPNFAGPQVTIESGMAQNLDWANFNNPLHRAESARVESGTWKICSDRAFQGECRVVGPGDYATLSGALASGIASAEPVVRPQLGALTPQ